MEGISQPLPSRGRILEVKKQILLCQQCELSQKCRSPIPLTLTTSRKVLDSVNVSGGESQEKIGLSTSYPTPAQFTVLGEAPGRIEDFSGKPFVGPAGQKLRGALREVGLDPDNAVYMNVVCCWPHGTPQNSHLHACRQNLQDQLSISPEIVLVCGRVALRSLIPHAILQHATGKLIPIHNKLVYPIFHPSYFLHKTKEIEMEREWKGMLAKFAVMVLWGDKTLLHSDHCVYCPGYGFPVCKKHIGMWKGDCKWRQVTRRNRKKGLQDEKLFEE